MMPDSARVQEAVDYVFTRAVERPRVGIVLGSGLGGLAAHMSVGEAIPYAVLPHFPQPTVAGHEGELVMGRLAGRPVAVLRGRIHLYEGHAPAALAMPVRLLRGLGCDTLIVTNAAGALDPTLAPGDLMLIRDHIFLPGLAGANPLVGEAEPLLGPRFVDMTQAYDPHLRQLAQAAAQKAGLTLREGVYVMVAGPSYETPAEVRFLRAIGGDAVGMSTCPEVVTARQSGMRVLGISAITNGAQGQPHEGVSHVNVLSAAAEIEPRLAAVVAGVVGVLEP